MKLTGTNIRGEMGNMFKLSRYGLAVMLACGGSVQAQTLMEAAAYTIESSPDVGIIKSQYLSRTEQIGISKAGFLPTVDLALGYGQEWTDSPSTRTPANGHEDVELTRKEASLTLSQLLYDGSRTSNEVDRVTSEATAHRYQLWSAAENITLEVADAYLNVLHAQNELGLAEQNLNDHIEILEGIRERSESGLSSASDLSQVKGRLSRAHANYLSTENNLLDAKARFFKIVGQEPDDLQAVNDVDENMPLSYEEALQHAGKVHPTLQAARFDVDAAEAQLRVQDAAFRPDVRFELGGTWNDDLDGTEGHNNDRTAMIRLRYNLFNGNADTYREKQAYYQLMEATGIEERAQRQVAEGLSLAWNAYKLLDKQMEFLSGYVEESDKTLIAYEQQFELSRRTLVDLLDAENELFESRRQLLTAERDYTMSKYRVLNAMGELLAVLNIDRSSVLSAEEIEEIQSLN